MSLFGLATKGDVVHSRRLMLKFAELQTEARIKLEMKLFDLERKVLALESNVSILEGERKPSKRKA